MDKCSMCNRIHNDKEQDTTMSVVGDCTKCNKKQIPVDELYSECGDCYWKMPNIYKDDPYKDKIEEIKKLIEAKLSTCRNRVEHMNWHGVAGPTLMIEAGQLELMESVMAIIDSQL